MAVICGRRLVASDGAQFFCDCLPGPVEEFGEFRNRYAFIVQPKRFPNL
jgi:hypothetical protein